MPQSRTESGEGVYEAEERRDNKRIGTMTDRNKLPGSDPVSFATMLNDTRAPPHVGPLLWAAVVMLMYAFRHHASAMPAIIWFATIFAHFAYTERKRWESKGRQTEDLNTQLRGKEDKAATAPALNGRQMRALEHGPWPFGVRVVLYALQFLLLICTITFGGSWWHVVAQVALCALFFLEHSQHISHVRQVYCELGVGPLACRLQR